MATPKGYSVLQVTLHWTIAALVIFQLLVNRGMQGAFDDRINGESIETIGAAVLHAGVGLTILLLAVIRLVVRFTRGAPAVHNGKPAILNLIGFATHLALYGFIFAMPLTGALALFGGVEASAELHEIGRWMLIPLIGLHALGALTEHFVFRNDTLIRMVKPNRD